MKLRKAENMLMIGDGSFLEFGPNKSNRKSMMLSTTMRIPYKIAASDPLIANRSFFSLSFSEGDLPKKFLEKNKYIINASIFHMYIKKFLPSVTVEARPLTVEACPSSI